MIKKQRKPLRKKSQEKRQAIIDAALRLFSERGYHATVVPDVARVGGVGAGTIYRYFESKEDLVNAVFFYAKDLLKGYLLNDFNLEADKRNCFHQLWGRLVCFSQEQPIAFRFLELQDHVPYLNQTSRNKELEILGPIWAFCFQARQEGIARDLPAESLMAMIWGAFVGLIKAQHLGYVQLNDDILQAAEEACWHLFCK